MELVDLTADPDNPKVDVKELDKNWRSESAPAALMPEKTATPQKEYIDLTSESDEEAMEVEQVLKSESKGVTAVSDNEEHDGEANYMKWQNDNGLHDAGGVAMSDYDDDVLPVGNVPGIRAPIDLSGMARFVREDYINTLESVPECMAPFHGAIHEAVCNREVHEPDEPTEQDMLREQFTRIREEVRNFDALRNRTVSPELSPIRQAENDELREQIAHVVENFRNHPAFRDRSIARESPPNHPDNGELHEPDDQAERDRLRGEQVFIAIARNPQYGNKKFKTLAICRTSSPVELLEALRNDNLWGSWTKGEAPFNFQAMAEIMATDGPNLPNDTNFNFIVAALASREEALEVAKIFRKFAVFALARYPMAGIWGEEGAQPRQRRMYHLIASCMVGFSTLNYDTVSRLEDIVVWTHALREKLAQEAAGDGNEGYEATMGLWKAYQEMRNWISFLTTYTELVEEYGVTSIAENYRDLHI